MWLLAKLLSKIIKTGQLVITDHDGKVYTFGPGADGMEGGPNNPLGARALYLFQEGRGDTFLRIHGTNDPASIGRAVSNGCAGLTNDHIRHLYDRVPMDTTVFLYPKTTADSFTRS